jgi:hypothetical protein
MATYEIVGDKKELSKGPNETPYGNPGMGAAQMVGDHIKMSRASVQSPSSDPRSGLEQVVGDRVAMARTPEKIISNNSLPFSARAHEQSNAPQKGGKKKR